MTQKTVQRWMLNNRYHIEDRDGELVICNVSGIEYPYLHEFLHYGMDDFGGIIANTDINLKKYRNSLINQVKSLAQKKWVFRGILDDAFEKDHMCKYLYTHEHVSRNISKKIWNDIIYRHNCRKYGFLRMIEDGIKSHMIRELKNVKSNRDLPAYYKNTQTFILEKFMEKHGRKRLQKVLKRITNEQFKGHKQMADRQMPEPKGDIRRDETLGGVVR